MGICISATVVVMMGGCRMKSNMTAVGKQPQYSWDLGEGATDTKRWEASYLLVRIAQLAREVEGLHWKS